MIRVNDQEPALHYGETRQEALGQKRQAILGYFEAAQKAGLSVPPGDAEPEVVDLEVATPESPAGRHRSASCQGAQRGASDRAAGPHQGTNVAGHTRRIGGTMEPVTIGEELLEERRRRRRAGDPRLTDADREILRRVTRGDLADEFQAALDADLVNDPLLDGRDTDTDDNVA